ncbi:restriction endonuclease subunit S, partial [Apilactobacillus sp. EABW-1NA]|uniref:restriction endonuclease subunit S n=1 Tax=Apilactobacillus sp. EABW-1NA TaxID=2984137 RepID=UPI0025B23D28
FDSINSSDIKLMTIKVPKEDEQQKIGTFFSKLDKLIKQQSRKLYQLKQQKKAYLQKMFI